LHKFCWDFLCVGKGEQPDEDDGKLGESFHCLIKEHLDLRGHMNFDIADWHGLFHG
jgi:hypothetical protein